MRPSLPQEVVGLLQCFRPAFTRPTFERFVLLAVGAILTMGRRSVSRILWSVRSWLAGHPSSYHRFFSRRRWSALPLGRILSAMVLELVPEDQPVMLAGDDTVTAHKGKKVYAKACHRDAVRSNTHGRMVTKWGHKWVVLAVLVRFPFSRRSWALPVLAALYRSRELNEQEEHRHKTPAQLAKGLLAVLLHWFPQRRFVFLGDGGFASHELARFCRRRCRRRPGRLVIVARCNADANLYALLPAGSKKRGRRYKGRKLPLPQETVAAAKASGALNRCELAWYGDSRRQVRWASACGGWYCVRSRGHDSVVPLRWVYVADEQSGREDYFYSTDPSLTPRQIAETFAGRWGIEVTFEELRAHLGLESTRQRVKASVLRAVPMLMGLFSLVSLIYAKLAAQATPTPRKMPCYVKAEPTFSDALYAVRRLIWESLLQQAAPQWAVAPLPPALKQTLLEHLAEAA